jgi:hypothetical protein
MNASFGNLATNVDHQHNTPKTASLWDIASTARAQVALVALGSAVLALAITRQSLWIDEAWTAWFAAQTSTGSLLRDLMWARGSDSQMPGYVLYMHAWVTLFGRTEIMLRFSNLPFAVVLLSSLSWISTVLLKRPFAWLIIAVSPFLWFYMNEARPYMMLMAGSGVVAAAVLAYSMEPCEYPRVAPWVAMASFTATLACYMLAGFIGATVLLLLFFSIRQWWPRLVSDWRGPVLVFLPFIAAITSYYAWTVVRGAGGARGIAGLRNVAFVIYEFCGFDGLGPPRNELRASGGSGLFAYGPTLVLGFAALGSVLALITIAPRRKIDRDFAASVAIGFAIAVLACRMAHFRFLGRHFAAFYPFALIALLMNTDTLSKRGRRWIVAGAFALLAGMWAVSDARLLLPSYGKEDYRSAAGFAIERARSDDGAILWAADWAAAYYYGLKLDQPADGNLPGKSATPPPVDWPVSERALFASNWTSAEVCRYADTSRVPIILVLGDKPDIFDQDHSWERLIREPEAHAVRIAAPNGFDTYEFPPKEGHSINACVRDVAATP